MSAKAVEIVKEFWSLMMTNDFRSVGSVLSDDFILDWPQSNERIRGRANFARMNEEYPAHGRWQFTVNRVVGDDVEAVSHVLVTDGTQKATVVSFFTVNGENISRMVEFWPDNYPAPDNRKHLVEKISNNLLPRPELVNSISERHTNPKSKNRTT
jgi:hypothetical protein